MSVISPIEEVLEVARTALLAQRAAAAERVEKIKQAADAYLRAIDSEFAGQFAQKNGLSYATSLVVMQAMQELKESVAWLAEATGSTPPKTENGTSATQDTPNPVVLSAVPNPSVPVTPPAASASVTASSVAVAAVTTAAPSVVATPTPAPAVTTVTRTMGRTTAADRGEIQLGPMIESLQRDIRATSFEELNDDIFRTYMEEYAARARYLQDHSAGHPPEEEIVGKLIRRLTAMVGERGMSGIYGLARSHNADWQQRANEAVRKRERLQNPSAAARAGSLTQKMKVPDAVREQLNAQEEDEDEGDQLDFPALRAAADRGPVVLIGGGVRNDKLDKIRRRSGLEFEWVALESDGMRAIDTLERRIRDNRIRALIVLQELMGHKHFEPLVTAARQVGLPFAYGGKAGKAALEKALREVEALTVQRQVNAT